MLRGAREPEELGDTLLANLPGRKFLDDACSSAHQILLPSTGLARLVVLPGKEFSPDEVTRLLVNIVGDTTSACLYSLDGVVKGAPFFDLAGHVANRDHHEGCDRVRTPCSARQVFDDVMTGRFSQITERGVRERIVVVNDADLDVALAVWMVANAEQLGDPLVGQRLNRLVELEDAIDRRCGAYPLNPLDPLVRAMAWINEPFVQARRDHGRYHTPSGMGQVILGMLERIDAYAHGRNELAHVDSRYHIEPVTPEWAILHEDGFYARGAACARENVDAFASLRVRSDGRLTVTLFKRTPESPFPIDQIEAALIAHEAVKRGDTPPFSWGGSKGLFTASPRDGGTCLSQSEFIAIVNGVLERTRH